MNQPTEPGRQHASPTTPDFEDARQWLERIAPGLLPPECRFATQRYDAPDFVPAPEDVAAVRGAVEKRQREFSAGRTAARAALKKLGSPEVVIPIGAERNPQWPAGLVGSITHANGLAVATVARQVDVAAVGIDLEHAAAMNESLWPDVLNANEIGWIRGQPADQQSLWSAMIFSAKESFYKLQYPLTNTWIDFHEAEVSVTPGTGYFHLKCSQSTVTGLLGLARFSGRCACGHGFTFTAMHLASAKG